MPFSEDLGKSGAPFHLPPEKQENSANAEGRANKMETILVFFGQILSANCVPSTVPVRGKKKKKL